LSKAFKIPCLTAGLRANLMIDLSKNTITLKRVKYFLYTLLINTILAGFLASTGLITFTDSLIIIQCMGISICICILFADNFMRPARPFTQLTLVVIASAVGSLMGVVMVSFFGGTPLIFELSFVLPLIFSGILFGSMISYLFIYRQVIYATKMLVSEERIKRLTSEKKVLESNLKLLQAQIEPHFLFNTLSNILSLLDRDLEKSKSMMEDLIHYLRTSLSKTRQENTTIGQEMEMIRAYLNIFKVRMEDRLKYTIDIPDRINHLRFPPMLIQPLVENAIKHGLEPKIEGGEIFISGEEKGDILRLEITDTGLGLHGNGNSGFGLSNIKERLHSLFGDKGRLIFEENRPSGMKAVIEVPYDRD
jgi:sensor histidine kinase YesM